MVIHQYIALFLSATNIWRIISHKPSIVIRHCSWFRKWSGRPMFKPAIAKHSNIKDMMDDSWLWISIRYHGIHHVIHHIIHHMIHHIPRWIISTGSSPWDHGTPCEELGGFVGLVGALEIWSRDPMVDLTKDCMGCMGWLISWLNMIND